MPRVFMLLLSITLAGCGLKTTAVGTNIERSALSKDGEGVVVVGFAASKLGGICSLSFGPADSGKSSEHIGLGWTEGDGASAYGSTALTAGRWELYKISCGNFFVHRPRKAQPFSFFGPTLNPLAHFTVFPGEVLYLGDLEIKNFGGLAGIRVRSRPKVAKQALTKSAPQLVDGLRTRLMKIIPRTRKPRKPPDSV